MTELFGKEYLKKKLADRRLRILARYRAYEQKDKAAIFGAAVSAEMKIRYGAVLGWCTKAVDALADRLVFREFDNDFFDLNSIFRENNPDVFFDSAILSALISSCCFVYVRPNKNGMPKLQVIEGSKATGVIDDTTGLLKEGYAILETDKNGKPKLEAYFEVGKTTYYNADGKVALVEVNTAPAPLLVPIIHRPDANRPFGRSRITRAAKYYQDYAKRTLERSDISAEFYSFPQKYVVGTSAEAEQLDTWKATMASLLEISKDEDGDAPKLGQFTQQTMTPFIEQMRMAAAAFAGETGLTLDDLGFVTDNPSSAEAIKASHETLKVAAQKAQRTFGSGFLNVGYLAACLRDEFAYARSQILETVPKWEPIFTPDASTLSLIGDGAIKINQAVEGFFDDKTLRDLTGVKGANRGT